MTSIMEWLSDNLPLITAILITIACAFWVCVTLSTAAYIDRKRHKNVIYYGKHYLYNFLKDHDYTVPMKKRMKYGRYGETELLSGEILVGDKVAHLDMYHVNAIICVTIWGAEAVEGVAKIKEIEFRKYVNGVLREQRINGRPTTDKIFEI